MIEERQSGHNTVHEIYEYNYLDTTYEMNYGHDLILDSMEARTQQKKLAGLETRDKVLDRTLMENLASCNKNYLSNCKKTLSDKLYTEWMNTNQIKFNFQNNSNNLTAFTKVFKSANFKIIKANTKQKKVKHKKKPKKQKTENITPKFIQIEAALYLGCERISQFSYSKPQIFG